MNGNLPMFDADQWRAALVAVNLAEPNRRKLERLQKMIFSLQPRRAWTIDGFNSDQFPLILSPPGYLPRNDTFPAMILALQ
jgi:hypothetical protein